MSDSGQSYFNAKEGHRDSQSEHSFQDANESIATSHSGKESERSGAGSSVNQSRDLSTVESINYDANVHANVDANDEDANEEDANDDTNDEIDGSNTDEKIARGTDGSISFLNDDPQTMTYGRILALYLSEKKKYAWYNPQLKQTAESKENMDEIDAEVAIETIKEKPSIMAGWAYFEHITLRRRKYEPTLKSTDGAEEEEEDGKEQQELELTNTGSFGSIKRGIMKATSVLKETRSFDVAAPGENDFETKLYNPVTTPLGQLGDFGLGVGLYFATLRSITIIMILAGLMNIPNFRYFSSQAYSNGQEGVSWVLKGSAVCTDQEWVPCPNCTMDDFKDTPYRVQNVTGLDENDKTIDLMFALKNNCDGAILSVGMVNFATTIFVMISMVIMKIYLTRMEVKFDEDEQTAQDYSIVVRNPPRDAVAPEVWRDFFMTIFNGVHVTCCTVVVDNDELIRSLVSRRELLNSISGSLSDENDFSVENLKKTADKIESERNIIQKVIAKLFGGVPAKYHQLVVLNERIIELSQQSHRASSVFVTFEKEQSQRWVLEKMNVSPWDASKQRVNAVSDPNLLFGGSHVCLVEEPAEPSAIRWQDLHETRMEQATKFITTGFILCLLFASYVVVKAVREIYPSYSAFVISISNSIFPSLAKTLSKFERHVNEERRQVWLYVKIAIFRCVNTVLLVFIITPYTSRIMDGEKNLLHGVYSIFYAEIVTSTVLQLLDLGQNFKRHYVAPRAKTQEALNLCMRGAEMMIAERYTNMTKLVFLALWYFPLYPGVLFMCAAALFVNFYADKFSLMRTWKPVPKLGQSMSRFNRNIIFPAMLIIMTYVATRSWRNFTYDSLCSPSSFLELDFRDAGKITFELEGIDEIINNSTVNVTSSSKEYIYCETNGEWMTDEQSRLTFIYETFFDFIAGIIGFVILVFIGLFVRRYFVAGYSAVGKVMDDPFSSVDSAVAYIPQVQSDAFAFPFLACSADKLRESDFLEQWNDPFRDVDYYDLTKDLNHLLDDNGTALDPSLAVFSSMIHCPPVVFRNER